MPKAVHPRTTSSSSMRRQQRVVSVRRASSKESSGEEETMEDEVVRLRGEVEALRKEVQRLLRLNADQTNNDVATNKPQPTTVPPPPPLPPTKKIPRGVPPRPPPPPPPPLRQQAGPSTFSTRLANSLLTNKQPQHRNAHGDSSGRSHRHIDIVGELQNRSRHMLAIKADIETKAEFINHLINKVNTGTYADVEQVLAFVDWLDQQLSTLSDETAVLKRFNWPERKADALREAASEYRRLKHLLTDISSSNDDGSTTPCNATLRKISGLLDRLEKNMHRLVNLRSKALPSYKELSIPTDWMLDSGMALKMRLASVDLAKKYMKQVMKELDSRDTAANEASLIAHSMRFTYRAHQFAGGLDCEAMQAIEELRRRVQMVTSP